MTRSFLLLLLLLSVMASAHGVTQPPRVVDGIIDLSDWNFRVDGPVNLEGSYEFYWQQQLGSEGFFAIDTTSADHIHVPGAWNGTMARDEPIGGFGYATYRVNVLTSERSPLALKIPDLGTSYRLIVDGKTLITVGRPGTDRADTTPAYRPTIVQFTPRSSRTELIFQVSNFHHRLGGIWLPVYLGTPQQLATLRENQLARDLILFGAILVIGLYNLALYALRTENRSSLYLGLFCILLSTRQIMVGDRFMTQVLPDLPFEWYLRIEYLGWYLAASAFIAFMRSLFPREFHRHVAAGGHALFGTGSLVVLVTPTWIFTFTSPFFQLLTVAALLYGTFVLVIAVRRRREGAVILLVAYVILFAAILSDILVNAGVLNNVLLLDLGLFVFVLCQSVLISYRFTQSFKTIEAQSAQLAATNLRLRTQEKLRRDAEVESEALHKRIAQSEKMEAIGLLAGGVAHDLNNILSTTVTYPELALLDLPEGSPLAAPLEMTRRAGLRAAAVIQDLLTLARRGVVQREVLDLNEVVGDYLASTEHDALIAEHKGVRIQTDLAEGLDNIEGSRIHLQKLLMNLVSNAIESMPGGGTVYVTTHSEYVRARDLFYMPIQSGHYVILGVEDEGTGIDPDDLDKVFEPFYTTKVMGQSGTGLGMSVVWGVVYDQGGAIDVISEKDVGTRFDVYLPRTNKPLPPRPEPKPLSELLGNGEKILVVDDQADQRELTRAVLVRLGYSPTLCATGSDAIEACKETAFDLALLDMIIDDGLDGLETYKALREIRPDLKTLLLSGFAETDQVLEAQRLGAGEFVRKPFTIETIGTRIRAALRGA